MEINEQFDQRINAVQDGFRDELKQLKDVVKDDFKDELDQFKNLVKDDLQDFDVKLRNLAQTLSQVKYTSDTEIPGVVTIGRMKPPEFNGQVPWSVYKRQFEAAASVNHWTTDEQ